MTYSFSNTPVYVSEGQTVRFKFKAPSAWNTTQSVTIQIGDQQTIWYITTIPEDFAPDPFPFTSLEEVDPDTLYVYGDGSRPGEDIVTISGLTPTTQASVSVTGSLTANVDNFAIRVKKVSIGETEFGDWIIPLSGSLFVTNDDEIQVRLRSNTLSGISTYVDISIGARTERWTISTKNIVPNVPEPFPEFDNITNAPLNTSVYSNILQVQGLNDTAVIFSGNANLYVGVSDTNTFFINSDGYKVLSDTTFELVSSDPSPTILNGQYLQLYVDTDNQAGSVITSILGIGDEPSGSNWQVTNGNFPSTNPNSFSFVDQSDVLEDSLIASDPAPLPAGITGLGTGVEVDVVLLSTTGTEPRIKIIYEEGGESSVGVFPTKVNNGDKIVLYNRSSATFGESVSTTIKVGQREILPWTIVTNSGPDTDADYQPPANLTNQAPDTEVSSSIVTVTGINRPITIDATNSSNSALISIDFATPVPGPVTFDPNENQSFRIFVTTDPNLSGFIDTTVTVGTGTPNQFTWRVTNYAVAPPPPDLKGTWYSKKNAFVDGNGDIRESKDDGHAIGTVITVLKQPDGSYGTLDGELTSRFPGYLDCDGSFYDASDYPDLYEVIGETYGGTGVTYDSGTKTYTGQFAVPDFRNRKLVGTGVVDGNVASSPFVPTEGSANVFEPGGIGGWWYVDNVDVAGNNPYEQIIGESGATTGVQSNFFTIGTVRTVFNAPIIADVDFTITGSVTAQIGPLLDTVVSVPLHTHQYITALCDGISGDPLIEWRDRGLASLPFQPDTSIGVGLNHPRLNERDTSYSATQIAERWLAALNTYAPNFQDDWNAISGADTLLSIVTTMIASINTGISGGTTGAVGDKNDRVQVEITSETWWPSPYSVLDNQYLTEVAVDASIPEYGNVPGGGGRKTTAVIDTNPTFVRIDSYTPPILPSGTGGTDLGTTESHSHLITLQPVIDFTTDFTYGNQSGPGDGRSGLGAAGNAINVTFNQSEVNMELNTATFTLNTSIKRPIPDVVFSPNRKVPLVPEFHKVKYIIKAF